MADQPTGSFSTPPPGAPREVSQPLSAQTRASQLAQARAHEKLLPPLPGPLPKSKWPKAQAKTSTGETQDVPPTSPTGAAPPPDAETGGVTSDTRNLHEVEIPSTEGFLENIPYQPAASGSDSPSRGQPTPSLDPGKVITGGFGDQPSYFPLTGPELKELVRSLFDQLNTQLDQDLRFGLASTYPQVCCTVTVSIDGLPGASTQDVAFSLTKQRYLELNAEASDTQATPPDHLRDQIALPKPHKHLVSGAGTGRPLFADVP